MSRVTPQDASVLALLAQRPEAFELLAKNLGEQALNIARYIAGKDTVPTPEIRATGESIKAWADARNSESI